MFNFQENSIEFVYKKVVGVIYHNDSNKKAIIFCKGGPALGDTGEEKMFSDLSKKHGITVVAADYIGSGRSAYTQFNIENSVKTIAICEELLSGKTFEYAYFNKTGSINIDNIDLVGHSWGATISSLYFKQYPQTNIKKLKLISGVLDYSSKEADYKGESDKEFWEQLLKSYKYYYKDIETSNWKDLVNHTSNEFNPLSNIKTLKDTEVKIIHAKNDDIIDYHRSELFYNKLKEFNDKVSLEITDNDHFNVLNKETLLI